MKIRCKNQSRPKNTVVQFGRKGKAGYVEYEFKPINAALHREDTHNPHVCDVLVPAHINALLAVPDTYVEYNGSDVVSEAVQDDDLDAPIDLDSEFDDLTAWDADKMNEDDLHRFAAKVLQVHPKQKNGIIACMKTALGMKNVNDADTCQALLRQAADKMIVQAKTLAKEAEIRDQEEKAEIQRRKEADEKAVAAAAAAANAKAQPKLAKSN